MKKTILIAALAVTALAGSAMAQTATPPSYTTPTPSAPSATPPSTGTPSTTMPSTGSSTSTMPSTGSTTSTTSTTMSGHSMFIDRQKTDEALSSELVGAAVVSSSGERIGDVNDLVIDTTGRVSGVVIGVGGFLGMGEKSVAVDYGSVTKSRDDNGRPRLTVQLTKESLKSAAPFVPVKKS